MRTIEEALELLDAANDDDTRAAFRAALDEDYAEAHGAIAARDEALAARDEFESKYKDAAARYFEAAKSLTKAEPEEADGEDEEEDETEISDFFTDL